MILVSGGGTVLAGTVRWPMRLLLEFCRDVDGAWEDWGKGSAYFAMLEFEYVFSLDLHGPKARHWPLSAFPFARYVLLMQN